MRLNKRTKDRLGALWVLLNISTEIDCLEEALSVMSAIEKKYRAAPDLWAKKVTLMIDDKIVMTFEKGILS